MCPSSYNVIFDVGLPSASRVSRAIPRSICPRSTFTGASGGNGGPTNARLGVIHAGAVVLFPLGTGRCNGGGGGGGTAGAAFATAAFAPPEPALPCFPAPPEVPNPCVPCRRLVAIWSLIRLPAALPIDAAKFIPNCPKAAGPNTAAPNKKIVKCFVIEKSQPILPTPPLLYDPAITLVAPVIALG